MLAIVHATTMPAFIGSLFSGGEEGAGLLGPWSQLRRRKVFIHSARASSNRLLSRRLLSSPRWDWSTPL